MNELASKKCMPCQGDVPKLKGSALQKIKRKLGHGWKVIKGHHLEKAFKFKNFREALAFTNKVGALAEAQNHHPDIQLSWGKVRITLWTHSIGGLSESDFILAAKVEELT